LSSSAPPRSSSSSSTSSSISPPLLGVDIIDLASEDDKPVVGLVCGPLHRTSRKRRAIEEFFGLTRQATTPIAYECPVCGGSFAMSERALAVHVDRCLRAPPKRPRVASK
jgi:hypothetical protein